MKKDIMKNKTERVNNVFFINNMINSDNAIAHTIYTIDINA